MHSTRNFEPRNWFQDLFDIPHGCGVENLRIRCPTREFCEFGSRTLKMVCSIAAHLIYGFRVWKNLWFCCKERDYVIAAALILIRFVNI